MKVIAELALMECKGGHATAKWQRQIQSIDRSGRLSKEALLLLQQLQARLGIPTTRPIALPVDDQPFWHRTQRPFADYRSTEELPSWADVVIIGAGLTGAAAAYHLKDARLNVVIIEKGDPAGEASGRNGGNFELLPENSVGTYEGLAPGRFKFMEKRYPHVPSEVLQAVSERQASLVLGLALRNRDLLKETILNEGIACDFSPKGWLHLAADEREGTRSLRRGLARCPAWSENSDLVALKDCRRIRDRCAVPGPFHPGGRNVSPIQVRLRRVEQRSPQRCDSLHPYKGSAYRIT
jgi:hypothetical protein